MDIKSAAFGKVEGAFIVTWEGGVFRQVDIYERSGDLFAKQKGGFLAIMGDGKTSHVKVTWKGIGGLDVIAKRACDQVRAK